MQRMVGDSVSDGDTTAKNQERHDDDTEKMNGYQRQQGDYSCKSQQDDEVSRPSRQSSFLETTLSDEETKRPAVPESVAVMDADNRSQCSQKSELGYHSAGALSDAPPTEKGGHHHEVNFDNRSHASEGALSDTGQPTLVPVPPVAVARARSAQHHNSNVKYMLNRESMQQVAQSISEARRTRNTSTTAGSVASYPASEAAKSDIATVCSSSIIEDIDMSSIMSGDAPAIGSNSATAALPSPSVASHPVVIMGGNFRRSISTGGTVGPRAVEFAPVASAKDPGETLVVPHKNMGPPLSRGLLTSLFPASATGPAAGGSRAGSVKSFGSNAGASQGSDAVDQSVDTDDGGGSLTDGHSVLSQDRSLEEETPHQRPALTASAAESFAAVNPLFLQDDSNNANGRTSPGGTIYKGKGVRRYQGRYMNLPLKRFDEENGGGGGKVSAIDETTMAADQEEKEQQHRRSGYRRAKFKREEGGLEVGGRRRRSRSRDRSASPVRRGGGGGRRNDQHSPRGSRRRGARSDDNLESNAWRHQPHRKGRSRGR